jgi:hypothetical protein
VCGKSDSASSLDLLAIFVESITDDRLGAILVGGDRLGREGVVGGIIKLFIISPVRAAITVSKRCPKASREQKIIQRRMGVL